METRNGSLEIGHYDDYISGEFNEEVHPIIYRTADGGKTTIGWVCARNVAAFSAFLRNAEARGVIFDPGKE